MGMENVPFFFFSAENFTFIASARWQPQALITNRPHVNGIAGVLKERLIKLSVP